MYNSSLCYISPARNFQNLSKRHRSRRITACQRYHLLLSNGFKHLYLRARMPKFTYKYVWKYNYTLINNALA